MSYGPRFFSPTCGALCNTALLRIVVGRCSDLLLAAAAAAPLPRAPSFFVCVESRAFRESRLSDRVALSFSAVASPSSPFFLRWSSLLFFLASPSPFFSSLYPPPTAAPYFLRPFFDFFSVALVDHQQPDPDDTLTHLISFRCGCLQYTALSFFTSASDLPQQPTHAGLDIRQARPRAIPLPAGFAQGRHSFGDPPPCLWSVGRSPPVVFSRLTWANAGHFTILLARLSHAKPPSPSRSLASIRTSQLDPPSFSLSLSLWQTRERTAFKTFLGAVRIFQQPPSLHVPFTALVFFPISIYALPVTSCIGCVTQSPSTPCILVLHLVLQLFLHLSPVCRLHLILAGHASQGPQTRQRRRNLPKAAAHANENPARPLCFPRAPPPSPLLPLPLSPPSAERAHFHPPQTASPGSARQISHCEPHLPFRLSSLPQGLFPPQGFVSFCLAC